jgi:hypothetical protein
MEKNGDIGLPLRKRVRNCMKLPGLQGCDKKQRSCWRSDETWEGLTPPGGLDGCENKGVAGKGICICMKTKREQNRWGLELQWREG